MNNNQQTLALKYESWMCVLMLILMKVGYDKETATKMAKNQRGFYTSRTEYSPPKEVARNIVRSGKTLDLCDEKKLISWADKENIKIPKPATASKLLSGLKEKQTREKRKKCET